MKSSQDKKLKHLESLLKLSDRFDALNEKVALREKLKELDKEIYALECKISTLKDDKEYYKRIWR